MNNKLRKYSNSDVDMLIAGSAIVDTAIENKTFLQSKRATWANTYFEDIKTRIDVVIQKYLGRDSAKELREATRVVTNIQKEALLALAELKVQIEEDFKKDKAKRDEILIQLGFTTYHKDAQNKKQEALINLLYKFKTNISGSMSAEITAKGTPSTLISKITGYADVLKDSDALQEKSKGERKAINATAIEEFNQIYDEIISICKISAKFYKDQPLLKDRFSYTKVIKTLHSYKRTEKPTP